VILAVILFLLAAYGASWLALHFGPLAIATPQ
jgi:hypothetical protein